MVGSSGLADGSLETVERVLHDANNLLVSLAASVAALRQQAEDPAAVRASLDAIEETIFVIGRLLGPVSVAQGRRGLPLDLGEELERHLPFWTSCAGDHVSFSLHVESGVPPVRVCRVELFRLVVNLLTNAAAATPPGGSISLHYRAAGNGRVCLEVRDTGVGMLRSEMSSVLRDGESGFGSTGLGLGTVQRLAVRCGGTFVLRSEPDKGTVASVQLPTCP